MKKNIFLQVIGITFCAFTIYSCSKSDTSLLADNQLSTPAESSSLKVGYNSFAKTAPTRVAKQYTVTNPETGQVQVFYDCRDAGQTCDVGETPAPTPPSNGRSTINSQDIRENTILNTYSKTSSSISSLFENKRNELIDIFPKIYDNEIQIGIKNGKLRLESNDSYIAIVENTKEASPVFVYKSNRTNFSSKLAPGDTTKTKVAKINTETGIVECKEAGSNCATARTSNFNVSASDYLQLLDRKFKNKNLGMAVLNKEYKIYETKSYLELKSSTKIKDNYYILK